MTIHLTDDLSSDEILVTYLDGELAPEDRSQVEARLRTDESFAARCAALEASCLPFRPAFDALLDEAPRDRLDAFIPPDPAVRTPTRRGTLNAIAAGCAGLLLGIGASGGYNALQDARGNAGPRRWRQAVADYMHLYTPTTFADLGDDPSMREAEFTRVSAALRLHITETTITLPGVTFRRAEILNYDGFPLAQIGYTDPHYGAMAFCLKPANFGPSSFVADYRLGMNIIYWATTHYAFLVIGRAPARQMRAFADQLRANITT